MPRRHLTALLAVVALLMGACTGTQEAGQGTGEESPTAGHTPAESATPTETATATPAPDATEAPTDGAAPQWTSCEHPEDIVVEYPEDWHVNDGEVLPPCSAFDPEPLDVPEAQEFFDAGVLLSVEPVAFSRIASGHAQPGEELSRRDEMVDGHDAVRIETESQGDAMLDAGTRTTRWIVVLGAEQTLTMVTHETGSAERYAAHQQVLDEMVTRLDLPDNR